LQGDTNRDVRDTSGKCVNASIIKIGLGEQWPKQAQDIIDRAGRRTGVLPPAIPPAVSPPAAKWPPSSNYSECNTPAPGPPRPAAVCLSHPCVIKTICEVICVRNLVLTTSRMAANDCFRIRVGKIYSPTMQARSIFAELGTVTWGRARRLTDDQREDGSGTRWYELHSLTI
jgi:hypothetical protein